MPDEALLRLTDLSVRRGGQVVLDNVSLAVDKGPPFALTGESGSGKTTLLFAVAGLLPPDGGTATVEGKSLASLSVRERARTIGLVFQDYHLFPHLTVLENLCLAPRLHGKARPEEAARALLTELRIGELAERRPHELSGGQKQRVAIARSLVLAPRVLLLDEPSAALDTRTSEELADLLSRLNERIQIVVVSHDLPFLERFCPRRARLEKGRLL